MSFAPSLWRVAERYLRGHRTEVSDMAGDYDRAGATYADTWQRFMGRHAAGAIGRAWSSLLDRRGGCVGPTVGARAA